MKIETKAVLIFAGLLILMGVLGIWVGVNK